MIDINTALQNILKAIYGKDVRQSIHDAIYQINQNANEAVDLAQIKFGTDITDPTSPVGDYIEGTVYFNVETGIIWKLSGGSWSQLGTMKTIDNIEKTSTSGLVDTYTISYNDGTTKNYTVTNGEKGTSVVNITKVSTTGNVDHYDVNLSDGTKTPNGFDVSNGISITDISLESTVGNVKNYNVKLSDGSKTPTGFSVSDGVSSYVYIRYSANFDGSGMVTVPSDQTVYIGICVTTQSTAPTDPAVYSWVRFIGKSGTGSGDMLASDYATRYAKTVDRAAALYDGTKEISADQLMDKATYADADLSETVKKATTLIDKANSKEADSSVLAKFSESAEGKLLYDDKSIEPDIDNDTIVRNQAGEMTLGDTVTTKLQNFDENGNVINNPSATENNLFTKLQNIDEQIENGFLQSKNLVDAYINSNSAPIKVWLEAGTYTWSVGSKTSGASGWFMQTRKKDNTLDMSVLTPPSGFQLNGSREWYYGGDEALTETFTISSACYLVMYRNGENGTILFQLEKGSEATTPIVRSSGLSNRQITEELQDVKNTIPKIVRGQKTITFKKGASSSETIIHNLGTTDYQVFLSIGTVSNFTSIFLAYDHKNANTVGIGGYNSHSADITTTVDYMIVTN